MSRSTKPDRIDCDWRVVLYKPGWQVRAAGQERILREPDELSFRVYASGGGWRMSARGRELPASHRKVWSTAEEAMLAAEGLRA